MNQLRITGKSALVFLFGILLTIQLWPMVTAIGNMIELVPLRAIYYVGAFSTWSIAVLITPFLLATGRNVPLIATGKGVGLYLISGLISLFLYHIAGPLFGILEGMTGTTTWSSYGWLGMGIIFILASILLPAYLMLEKVTQ